VTTPFRRRRPSQARLAGTAALAAFLSLLFAVAAGFAPGPATPVLAAAAPSMHPAAPAAPRDAGSEEAGASHEGASPWALVARLFNFAVLAGTLVYFLRSPFMKFLADRRVAIRAALVKAAEQRVKSAKQLADLDRRLVALPAEIESLRARGLADVAAEEARILSAAEAERARLVEQAKRQIDAQLRVAKRELVAHAADLAVTLASERIRRMIRDDDQARLVDAYLSRVKTVPAASAGGRP